LTNKTNKAIIRQAKKGKNSINTQTQQKQQFMKAEHKNKALEILTSNNSTGVIFNVPINDNRTNVYEILITRCNASTIKELVSEGFSLFMTEKGLQVENFH
jgi:hypothetical protein